MMPSDDAPSAARADVESPGPGLAAALAYCNDEVVHKFLERYAMSFEEAQELFEETKKWLWLCARAQERGVRVAITRELFLLDEMWHTFILFTQAYHEFCHECLNGFIHHFPMTRAERELRARARAADPEAEWERHQQMLREEMTLIGDELGEDTLFKWFVDYPRRYGPAFIARAVRPPDVSLSPVLTEQLDSIAERYHRGDGEDPSDHRQAAPSPG